MQFEYDPEQLITEVQKRPGIWNRDHPDYRDKHAKMKLWSDIVNELMNTENIEISKTEMRELELQLQRKWKSLRDCFQKYLINPNRTRKPYLFAKQLQFLCKDKELPKSNAQVGSSDSDEEEPPKKKIWKTKRKIRILNKEEESDTGNNDESHYYEEYAIKPESDVKQPIQVEQFAFANVQDSQLKYEEDTDKMFLLSLLPHLKSIPKEFRLNVKVELMNVLRTAYNNTSKLRYGESSRLSSN